MKIQFTLIISLLISLSSFAQQGINYKAVIKDDLGNIVAGQPVTIQFIIYEGSTLTSIVYQESHPTTTDANGIVIVNIGKGTTSNVFTDIDWGSDTHWLNVKVDIGSGLVDIGTTQFMAVPYALNAANVSGLEAIDEGKGIGWRLVGSSSVVYGPIGYNAVDLSIGGGPTNDFGATGSFSIAMGNQARAFGDHSISIGSITSAESYRSTAFGSNNIGGGTSNSWFPEDPLFEIGNSLDSNNKTNALTILKNGTITAPSFDFSEILDDKALITKEYLDATVPEAPSGLEKITEGSNTGWRLKGRDPNNYGLIGKNAIDLSYQQHPSETRGATGVEAFASGWRTEASGVRSVAMGHGTIASGYASTALGSYNVDGEYIIFSVGRGSESVRHNALTLTAYDEFIIGSSQIDNDPTSTHDDVKFFFDGIKGAIRAGKVSLASGDEWNKDNLGLYSVAFGVGTKASGHYSSAMGSDTNASGISSTALGDNTNAIGLNSIAMGTGSTATGHYSTAMGNNTNAIGLYSSAMGLETIAATESSTAMGKYNTADIDGLFIIGNGTGTSAAQRKNALIVRTNGDSQFSGEIQRTTTGSSNMVPIAYGTIESNANELSGTGNFSATIAAGIITITVDNEALTFNNSSCSIVPYGIGFRSSSITYTNNKLNVYIFNSSGTLTPTTFQFVIYKL